MGDGCPERGDWMLVPDDIPKRHLGVWPSQETIPWESLEHKGLCDHSDVVRLLRGINHCDSTRSLPREGQKALPNPPMKQLRFPIKTILFTPGLPPSGETSRCGQIEQEREIG
jgi:hypothetical protein